MHIILYLHLLEIILVHLVDRNSEWLNGGSTVPYNVSVSGTSIKVSQRGKSLFFGTIIDSSTIMVTHIATGGSIRGKLEEPNKIIFRHASNDINMIWTKVEPPRDWEAELDGFWKGGVENLDVRPHIRISVSGSSIRIDMSDHGRPEAHGSILDDTAFTVTFPDDRAYTGKVERGQIHWSNGTLWSRAQIEG